MGSSIRRWVVERRLAHIRALLHDPVKRELGKEYDFHFRGAHFAHHGGPPGTTARMEAWLGALSRAIHAGELSPALVASILRFLEAPRLDEDAGQAISQGAAAFEETASQVVEQQEEPSMESCPDDKTDSGAEDGAEEGAEEGAAEAADIVDASSPRPNPAAARHESEESNEAGDVLSL